MFEPRPNYELRSVSVPRIFLQMALDRAVSIDAALAIRVHDTLATGMVGPQLLNNVAVGPAQMAFELLKYAVGGYPSYAAPTWIEAFRNILDPVIRGEVTPGPSVGGA